MVQDEEMRRFARMVAEELKRWDREPQLLNEADAAKLCGLTARSLQEMRYQGSGPPFVKLGDGRAAPIRYGVADLHLWINTRQRYRSTRAAQNDGIDENSREP